MSRALPTQVSIREVGPRDGFQAEAPLPPQSRSAVIRSLLDAGIRRIEAVSFVSPRAVPSMDHPEEVLASIDRAGGVTIGALVPNLRGAQLALDAGVDEVDVTIAVSARYNERNVKMTIDQSLAAISSVCDLCGTTGAGVDAVISCAFGSPYEGEGDILPTQVAALAKRLTDAGATAITLADTTGMGTPRLVEEVIDAVRGQLGAEADLGLHMHETRGTGLVNCYAAMEYGVSRFDTSIGGLGGSPFAEQSAGNVSTEDFVALLDDMGVDTGIDLERLLIASALTEELVGHRLASRVAYSGPRTARTPGG
jgi:hydroxymethylglutaryl-CoA lyase